ncbi:class II fructose-bisphosphate aldolase [Clostridium algoriphilum]|uniref:class II fructose-bisphosphate aldolase n=1 Tax=Clostridium algoriphilum TaxID=198347 RepID=UPI001CF5E2CA|nr:class II fructose-bisphosphate aldolase [Clostridium algoriphilum]MCB2295676.1 class II fructose-bisphosphate aldolase [Clostridium algoriphilum]
MYLTLKEILKNTRKNKFAVGSFNIHCLEMVPSMIKAAKAKNSPIILQISPTTCKYIGAALLCNVVKELAKETAVNVTLHLDHTKDFLTIKDAIDNGFSSVMIDASALSLEENIKKTKEVVNYAKQHGVSVEAELGTIGGTEDGVALNDGKVRYTSPEDAVKFVKETGIDALAIGFGTSHGQWKSKAKLSFDVLKNIHDVIDIPLVLHGGTGVSEEDLKKCILGGISKVNIGTELNVAWVKDAKEHLEKADLADSCRDLVIPSNDAVQKVIENKIDILGSSNK